MTDTNRDVNYLIEIASQLEQWTEPGHFIPCYADRVKNKKPPVSEVANSWHLKQYNAAELIQFTSMESVGFFPGERFVIFDFDGASTIEYIKKLEIANGELPRTYRTGSNPGVRESRIFELPGGFIGRLSYFKISTPEGEQLEVRIGSNYQIVAGMHPSGKPYEILDLVAPAKLPEEWCEFLEDSLNNLAKPDKSLKNDNGNGNGNIPKDDAIIENDLSLAEQILDFFSIMADPPYSYDEYQDWIQVGMILHSITSGSDSSLELWHQWSAKSVKYDAKELDSKWKTFGKHSAKSLTIATLIRTFQLYFDKKKTTTEEISPLAATIQQYERVYAATKVKYPDGGYSTISEDEFKIIIARSDLNLDQQAREIEKYVKAHIGYLDRNVINRLNRLINDHNDEPVKLEIKEKIPEFPIDNVLALLNTSEFELMKRYAADFNFNFADVFTGYLVMSGSLLRKGSRTNLMTKTSMMLLLVGVSTGTKSRSLEMVRRWFINKSSEASTENNKGTNIIEKLYEDCRKEIFKSIKGIKGKDQIKMALWDIYQGIGEFGGVEYPENFDKLSIDDIFNMIFESQVGNVRYHHPYASSSFTAEGLRDLSAMASYQGVLVCPDEIKSQVNYQKKFGNANPNSNGLEAFHSFLDEESTSTSKAGGISTKTGKHGGTIVSTIQPLVLNRMFNIENSEDGFISRVGWINIPELAPINPMADTELELEYFDAIGKRLELIDDYMRQSQPMLYTFEPEARQLYVNWVNNYVNGRYDRIDSAYTAWIRRSHEKLNTIALYLHIQQRMADPVIKVDTMIVAYKIMEWLVVQAKSIFKMPIHIEIPEENPIDEKKLAAFDVVIKMLKDPRVNGSFQYSAKTRKNSWLQNQQLKDAYGIETSYINKAGFITIAEDMAACELVQFDKESLTISLPKPVKTAK